MPNEAKMLDYAFSLNFRELLISLVVIASVFVALHMLAGKIQEIAGIETKSMRERRLVKENIARIREEMDQIKVEQSESREIREEFNQRITNNQEKVMGAIQDLTHTIEKNEIENIRWTILDFTNALSSRKYDKSAYDHIFDIHTSYINLLQKNNMQNGLVDIAMDLTKERYEQGLRDGFPV